MTWLTGSTTWGDLENEIAQLMCGEKASSGNAATVSAPDRWARDTTRTITATVSFSGTTMTDSGGGFTAADVGLVVLNANVPGGTIISAYTNSTTVTLSAAAVTASTQTIRLVTNSIHSHTSEDVSLPSMSNRTGYFTSHNAETVNSLCKVTTPFTTTPSSGTAGARWAVSVTVVAANTTPGNYSTLRVNAIYYSLDGLATIDAIGNIFANSAGLITLSNGLTVTMTDPSGTVPVNLVFTRAFTTAYLYGIDQMPMLYRTSGSPSFSVAPPGVAATDYDIVRMPYNAQSNEINYSGGGRHNLLHGVGIKTATGFGGGGALYTYSLTASLLKMRVFRNTTTEGQMSIDTSGSWRDTNSLTNMRGVDGFRITNWMTAFASPGAVTSSTVVQYWLSVKKDGVVISLYGDPGSTGKLSTAWIGRFTTYEPTYDKFPIACSSVPADLSADFSSGVTPSFMDLMPYWGQRVRQDGTVTRDWQNGWALNVQGRPYYSSAAPNTQSASYGNGAFGGTTTWSPLTVAGTTPYTASSAAMPPVMDKPSHDGKWWLFKYTLTAGDTSTAIVPTPIKYRLIRGVIDRFYFISENGWGNGDELTDSITSAKYFLVKPDYPGAGHRNRVTNNTFSGGVAILEA